MWGKGFFALIPVKKTGGTPLQFGHQNRPQGPEGVSAMWNAIYGMTGHSGAMGATLGLIWLLGLGVATYAWLTLPPSHRRH
jgi:hypothetical protein